MENKNFNVNYAVLLGFLSLITAGSLLLWALGNYYYNLNLSFLDAVFTSV
nr:hypothetical protein [Synergistaceae bacterium]